VLVPSGHTRHLFGEGLQLTGGDTAEEPSYFQLDHHRAADSRQIPKTTPVPAVHPARQGSTGTADRLLTPGPRGDQEPALGLGLGLGHSLDVHVLQVRQEQMQQIKTAGFLAHHMVQHNDPHGRSVTIMFLANPIITERPSSCAHCYPIAIRPRRTPVTLRHGSRFLRQSRGW
jgi:hypothetical protein